MIIYNPLRLAQLGFIRRVEMPPLLPPFVAQARKWNSDLSGPVPFWKEAFRSIYDPPPPQSFFLFFLSNDPRMMWTTTM